MTDEVKAGTLGCPLLALSKSKNKAASENVRFGSKADIWTCITDVRFVLTLDEALRIGAIIRGMDIDEEEVRLSEDMAEPVREKVLQSGDEKLVRLLRVLPEESFARLKDILDRPE